MQLPAPVNDAIHHGLREPWRARHEFWFRSPDGRGDIEVGLSATHLETPGGRARFLFTFQDVTSIKSSSVTPRIQQRLAAVGEMAAGIAHEIRNPLASMSGSIQIPAAGAALERRAGAADGHRPARDRNGSTRRSDRFWPCAGRSGFKSSASTCAAP